LAASLSRPVADLMASFHARVDLQAHQKISSQYCKSNGRN
jgi:hypothetical protein